jgi:hypothetical protein
MTKTQQMCRRHFGPAEVLSHEEQAILAASRPGERLDAEEAARRTGMPKGLAALALDLLEFRAQ